MKRASLASPGTLVEALASRNVSIRIEALEALATLQSPIALRALLESAHDRSPMVRVTVAECLGRVSVNRRAAVHELTRMLNDRIREVRMRSAESLGSLLSGTHESPSALVRGLKDPDELVRIESAEALGAIGDQTTLPFLVRALGDSSPLVRSYVAGAIGSIGNKATIRTLQVRLIKERSSVAKVGLYHALYVLGEHDAISKLRNLSQNKNYRVRCAVADTLGAIAGTSNTPDVPGFLKQWLRREQAVAVRSTLRRSLRQRAKKL